jgi:hypothetical protein
MENTNAAQERISELIWRTIQLRVTLLVLALFGTLITWSALLSGDQQAKNVEQEFCRKIVESENNSFPKIPVKVGPAPPGPMDSDLSCTESGARVQIEALRATNPMLANTSSESARKDYRERVKLLSDYDAKRESNYKMQIQLSSVFSGATILVNALTVAEFAPFIVLVVGSVVLILGFQEEAYKHQLKLLIETHGVGSTLAAALARTNFFALPLIAKERNKIGWLLSAEKLTLYSLGTVVLFALLSMMSQFIVNLIHLTDSILFNYASLLLLTAFSLAAWLLHTRTCYRRNWGVHFSREADSETKQKHFRAVASVLAGVAFMSLFLPWATSLGGQSLRGSYFLLHQPVIVTVKTPPIVIRRVEIEPTLYAELRIQIWIAIGFLCISLVSSTRAAGSGLRKILRFSRFGLGATTVFLSLNLLLYMAILEYEAENGSSWSMQNIFTNRLVEVMKASSPSEQAFGLPLDIYNPSYGVFLFMVCCFLMFWYPVKNEV